MSVPGAEARPLRRHERDAHWPSTRAVGWWAAAVPPQTGSQRWGQRVIPSAHVSVWGRARRRRVGDRFEYERERGAEFQRGPHLACEGGRGGGAGKGSAWGCKGGKGWRGQGRKGVAGQPWEGEEGAATSRGGGGDGGRLVRATHHQHELGEARQPTGYHRLAWRRARQACQSTLRWYVRPRTPRATTSAPGTSRATASARGFSSLPRQSPPAPPCPPPPPRGAPPPALLEQLLHVLAGRTTSRRRLAPPNPTGRGAVALTIGWGGAESGASSPTPTVSSRGAGGCRSRGGGGERSDGEITEGGRGDGEIRERGAGEGAHCLCPRAPPCGGCSRTSGCVGTVSPTAATARVRSIRWWLPRRRLCRHGARRCCRRQPPHRAAAV